MTFSFTTLGIASATPTVNRYQSAHVLNVHERLFLLDCGEGCQMQLKRFGFSLLKVRTIFISHLHGDHIFGLAPLLSSMAMLGRKADLDIYAPKRFSTLLNFFMEQFGEEFLYRVNHKVVEGDQPTLILDERRLQIFSFPLNHRVECYGYLFKEKEPPLNIDKELLKRESLSLYEIARLKEGSDVERDDGTILKSVDLTYKPYTPRSFAYCSDTAYFDALASYVKGCDLIYHEATFASDLSAMAKKSGHSTAAEAATIAKDGGVKKLLIGHFSSRYRDLAPILEEARAIFPNTEIAEQGRTFTIDIERKRER